MLQQIEKHRCESHLHGRRQAVLLEVKQQADLAVHLVLAQSKEIRFLQRQGADQLDGEDGHALAWFDALIPRVQGSV